MIRETTTLTRMMIRTAAAAAAMTMIMGIIICVMPPFRRNRSVPKYHPELCPHVDDNPVCNGSQSERA